jgi:hypothetical protein
VRQHRCLIDRAPQGRSRLRISNSTPHSSRALIPQRRRLPIRCRRVSTASDSWLPKTNAFRGSTQCHRLLHRAVKLAKIGGVAHAHVGQLEGWPPSRTAGARHVRRVDEPARPGPAGLSPMRSHAVRVDQGANQPTPRDGPSDHRVHAGLLARLYDVAGAMRGESVSASTTDSSRRLNCRMAIEGQVRGTFSLSQVCWPGVPSASLPGWDTEPWKPSFCCQAE